MEQRSPEWFEARLGRLTSSRIADATARTKEGWGASRARYMSELIIERLTQTPTQSYTNAAMQWGTDTEPHAIAAYEWVTGRNVEKIAFVPHPKITMAGCSPDGYVMDDGLVEIKCPDTHTHIATLLKGGVEGKYIKQIQFQMACTGRKWCDFVSFDPRLPPRLQLFVRRIDRSDETVAELEKQAVDFLRELDETIAKLDKITVQVAL